jgi:predicted N-acyltransferase
MLQIQRFDSINAISSAAWDALLTAEDKPLLSHAFLKALEDTGCLGASKGWYPCYFTVFAALPEAPKKLLAAIPAFLKTNSYGEFVFDHQWASAYERLQLDYYPKLIIAVPYTPATGNRLLLHPDARGEAYTEVLWPTLQKVIQDFVIDNKISSIHWLFPKEEQQQILTGKLKLPARLGCQYHWQNQNFSDFEAFLATMNSKRRKEVKRERRKVQEQGIVLEQHDGRSFDKALWSIVYRFYVNTHDKHWGWAVITEEFFEAFHAACPEGMFLTLARDGSRYVAGAIHFQSDSVLYGRYWGSEGDYDSLHFETCYYQGIDYCIAKGFKRFEPGAGGEHKISRGFMPTFTYSAHWLADARLHAAIEDFCQREQPLMQSHCAALAEYSPFKHCD